MGDEDVLKNFKRVAERVTDLTPLQVIDVYMLKHMDSISSYSDPNISQAEPVKERFADMINYLCLKYALLVDMGYVDAEFGQPCRAWGNPDTWTITNQPGSPGETL